MRDYWIMLSGVASKPLFLLLYHQNKTVLSFYASFSEVSTCEIGAPKSRVQAAGFWVPASKVKRISRGAATNSCLPRFAEQWSRLPNRSIHQYSNSCHYAFACWKRPDRWLSRQHCSRHAGRAFCVRHNKEYSLDCGKDT